MPNKIVSVAGVTFKNPDGSSRQKILYKIFDEYWTEPEEGEETKDPDLIKLELRIDHDNQYDDNAVAVCCIAPEEISGQLGHVPRADALEVKTAIQDGRVRRVKLEDVGYVRTKLHARVRIGLLREDDGEGLQIGDLFEGDDGHTYRSIG